MYWTVLDSKNIMSSFGCVLQKELIACVCVLGESSSSSPHQEENTMETSTEEAFKTATADEVQGSVGS